MNWQRVALHYGLAVVAVAVGVAVRKAFDHAGVVGLPTYITFYPAVMMAALIAGLGPGLLATVLCSLAADYWVTEPVGRLFAYTNITDPVGEALFACMGVFMSVVAALYKRNRHKAVAYDREQAQRESQELVRQQREWLRVTLTSIGDAVLATDTAGQVTFLNTVAARLTGWQEGQAVGQPVQTVFHIINEQTGQPGADIVGQVLREGRAVALANHTALVTRSGQQVPVEDSAAPITDAAGQVVGAVLVFHDVTEKRLNQAALQRTLEELKRSNAELEQFAYVASHDLQEPLRAVNGFLGLLMEGYGASFDDKARQFIGHVTTAAERMSQLIRDLLEYSRVQISPRVALATDMNEVFQAARANCEAAIQASNATVTADTLPTVLGDRGRLVQLLQNLVGNAIKFRREDFPPKVTVSARREGSGSRWTFAVQDNGIGIPMEHAERIFVIFQRLHGRGKYPGTGIGLSISRKIVEQHGGRIWIESKLGEGSRFCFTLPEDASR